MPRIAGINVPDNKQIQYSLTYIYGVGLTTAKKICADCSIEPTVRAKDLSEGELSKIRDLIREDHLVEGELQRVVTQNIKRLKDIGAYRGERHKRNLPSRGQRTKTNARTRRGKRIAVGGAQPKAAAKT